MRFTKKGNLSLQPLGSAISGKVLFFELDGRGRRGDGAGGTARLVPLPPSRVHPREPRAGEWGKGVAKTGFLGPRESGGRWGAFVKQRVCSSSSLSHNRNVQRQARRESTVSFVSLVCLLSIGKHFVSSETEKAKINNNETLTNRSSSVYFLHKFMHVVDLRSHSTFFSPHRFLHAKKSHAPFVLFFERLIFFFF